MFAFPTNGGCRILKRRSLWGNCTVILAAKKKEILLSGGGENNVFPLHIVFILILENVSIKLVLFSLLFKKNYSYRSLCLSDKWRLQNFKASLFLTLINNFYKVLN
jgi:hypothetical protein